MNRVVLIRVGLGALAIVLVGGGLLSLPYFLQQSVELEQKKAVSTLPEQFPVTVNPQEKRIVESPQVNELFGSPKSSLQAAAGNLSDVIGGIFTWLATTIADAPWYQALASSNGRFVVIKPGMRKEQVAGAFAAVLGWNASQKKEFLTPTTYSSLPLAEGSFSPGTYLVGKDTTPLAAQTLVNQRFSDDILAHYGTTTAAVVPLQDALTIASLIEREAGGAEDMRYISGIIWNRLFINMSLQIDATVQYVKASTPAASRWWPVVLPADLSRQSAYNTYLHKGLPPTPIASPSVASVLAALNPKNTTCLFYFHDSSGRFHCTDTYAEHMALIKKYYGHGN
ncbi:MAG: hypothetical protein RLZZ26_114 [Candidatus Parcubacteria bacterium]|jgi:cell division protein YceG involved in septum cleavage